MATRVESVRKHLFGFGPSLRGIQTLEAQGPQLAQDPAGAQALLTHACREAVLRLGARAVVIGGAALAGMAERAALHGGSLTARPRPGGGFAVSAVLPYATATSAP